MSNKTPKPSKDHLYRGKDVTGALDYVQSLFGDLWGDMPEEDRPRTDREAASCFFKTDRAGYNMEEFLEFLKDHNADKLKRLANSKRKPPKKIQ